LRATDPERDTWDTGDSKLAIQKLSSRSAPSTIGAKTPPKGKWDQTMQELIAAIDKHSRVVHDMVDRVTADALSGKLTVWEAATVLACLLKTTKRLNDLMDVVFDRQKLEREN
jgi:hypothetical protein